jgi:hypothetical protein
LIGDGMPGDFLIVDPLEIVVLEIFAIFESTFDRFVSHDIDSITRF